MSECRLISPDARYERTHESFVSEFLANGERVVPWIAAEPYVTFGAYVERLEAAARGIGIGDFVPHSTFWFVDSRDEIVGISNLRHQLTDRSLLFGGHIGFGVRPSLRRRGYATELLQAMLAEARSRGLHRIRLTCDELNVASASTIRRCGGVLDEKEFMPEHNRVVARYWIEL